MRILLTGANGYIGMRLLPQLIEQGHDVVCAVRNKNRPSESKAVEYLTRREIPYVRYGLDALDSDLPIYRIPPLIRSAPDYIIFNQNIIFPKNVK